MTARRKVIYDYIRRYSAGKFEGWEVCKVRAIQTPRFSAIAVFYGPKARSHAQIFTKHLNQEILE